MVLPIYLQLLHAIARQIKCADESGNRMTVQNTDYDAARTLLALHGTLKRGQQLPKEEMEGTRLFLDYVISKHPVVPNESYPSQNPAGNNSQQTRHVSHDLQRNRYYNEVSNQTKKIKTETREISTQTEEIYINPRIEFMENTITTLYERIRSLEAELRQVTISQQSSFRDSFENSRNDRQTFDNRPSTGYLNVSDGNLNNSKMKRNNFEYMKNRSNEYKTKTMSKHYSYPAANDLVPLGEGNAVVPARILKNINWKSYTNATRKLLTAVFTRRILATHSLTGKSSPAFPNKPAKERLDPALVNDIVQTVSERCFVPENVVRTSITTKCADESKMLKTRLNNKKRRISKKNCENIPPTTSESEFESDED